MPWISANKIRKCKWCEKPQKKYYFHGLFKGYAATCGSESCLKANFSDGAINLKRARLKLAKDAKCELCGYEWTTYSRGARYCKTCIPSKSWEHRANRYGIGKPQWDVLLKKQENKCALCEDVPEVVDHNHKTGKIRSLLCYGCNLLVGLLEKDGRWISRTLKYVAQ